MKYLRPQSIEEVLLLLDDGALLGGGTLLTPLRAGLDAVIDLQDIRLEAFEHKGGKVRLGAAQRIQVFIEYGGFPPALAEAARHEAAWNLRNAATLGGTLVAGDGRSPLLTALAALGGSLLIEPGSRRVELEAFFTQREQDGPGYLITEFAFDLPEEQSYMQVARSPMDRPLVCVSASRSGDGVVRVSLGGTGLHPIRLVDAEAALNPDRDLAAAREAAEAAFAEAGDAFASAAYRADAAGILVQRAVEGVLA